MTSAAGDSTLIDNGNGSQNALTRNGTRPFLIKSVGVFCEGVKNSTDSTSFNHFVVLKWDVDEQFLYQSSRTYRQQRPEETNDVIYTNGDPPSDMKKPYPLVYVVEQKTRNSSDWETIAKVRAYEICFYYH